MLKHLHLVYYSEETQILNFTRKNGNNECVENEKFSVRDMTAWFSVEQKIQISDILRYKKSNHEIVD